MNWLEYYKCDYLDELNTINRMRKRHINEDKLCAEYVKFFEIACNLLKLYLNYNGLFQFVPREVIKEAFYVELINDGERWINALSLAEIYQSGERKEFNNLILSYCKDENFVIYENLKEKFMCLTEEYE